MTGIVVETVVSWVFPIVDHVFATVIGRRIQRRRARRLARHGKIRSVLFHSSHPRVMDTRSVDGAADVSTGRIRLHDVDLSIESYDLPPQRGPIDGQPDGDLWFRPRTLIFTLRTHNNGRVRWAVLDWQADVALAMLGVPGRDPIAD